VAHAHEANRVMPPISNRPATLTLPNSAIASFSAHTGDVAAKPQEIEDGDGVLER
jgi:hypothetical protein